MERCRRNHASSVTREDVDAVRAAGWSDEAIYDAVTVCALFNIYTTWVRQTHGRGGILEKMKYYEYNHVVGFQETNLIGNVYYVHYLSWQGRCREMFLHDHAPSVLEDIAAGLKLATVRVACEYEEELLAFDRIAVRMSLGHLKPNGMTLRFTYVKVEETRETIVARGEMEIACLRGTAAVPVPEELREALRPYREEAA